MEQRHGRAAAIDSRIDTDTGEFDMVMATEGEASDGHIIRIAGLEYGDEIPLQLDHSRSVLSTVGVVRNLRKGKVDGVPALRGTGVIRLTGDGDQLAARRDLVDGIASGDLRSVSMTWDGLKVKERRDLPANHPHHVASGAADARKRWGLYFESARIVEQSIVSVGADRNALIGRAETAENAVSREIWQNFAEGIADRHSRESEIIHALEVKLRDLEQRLGEAEASRSSDPIPETDPLNLVDVLDGAVLEILERSRRGTAEFQDAVGDLLHRVTGK